MIRLFSVFIPSSILGLLLSETLLIASCFVLSLNTYVDEIGMFLQFENGFARVTVVTLSMIIGLYLNDLYKRVRLGSVLVFFQQLCLVVGAAFLLQAILSYGRLQLQMPRTSMMAGSVACIILIPAWRAFYSRVALKVLGAERIAFIGTHPINLQIAEYLSANRELAMNPVGFYVENESCRDGAGKYPILGTLSEAPSIPETRYDGLIVGLNENVPTNLAHLVPTLQQLGRRVESMSQAYEKVFGKVAVSQLRPMDILFTSHFAPSPFFFAIQALYSWILAFLGLVAVSPIMIITAIAVRVDSKGPILYRQTRTGRNGVTFELMKFRSMYIDAEKDGAVWATENDPRITPVGRFIRKYRIDEFPQFFNVLRGEMSLVGPRPERPEFIEMLSRQIPFYGERHIIRPGITGWAQINYRYGNTLEDSIIKLEYDLYYVKNLSPQLDFYIMFHTMKTMLLTTGAY
jgi:exopolysaccharide biosynthesis polyprenyl glycosylphosphotransferase